MKARTILSALTSLALVYGAIAISAHSATGKTATVNVARSKLGTILVDSNGRTLYLRRISTNGSTSCTNVDGCLRRWPPLMATGAPQAGPGVDPILLGTVHRISPTGMQVTYNRHPLYTYSQDKKPGDLNGQGYANRWYVVSPIGRPITKK
jgi:predicted lipoprotein with Yx(FWY)xxD motif